MNDRTIIELFENVAGFARTWKSRKTGTAGAHTPGRYGHPERTDPRDQCLDIMTVAGQPIRQCRKIIGMRDTVEFIVIVDQTVIDTHVPTRSLFCLPQWPAVVSGASSLASDRWPVIAGD